MAAVSAAAKIPTVGFNSSAYRGRRLPLGFEKLQMSPPGIRSPPSISCTMTREAAAVGEVATVSLRPDSFGRFGKFGGKYVPETLMHALTELEEAFRSLAKDEDFQVVKRKHKCTRCGGWGHHRNTCKMPINPPQPQQSNQPSTQQSNFVATNTSSMASNSSGRRERERGRRTTRGGRGRGGHVPERQSESPFDMAVDPFPRATSARKTMPLRGKQIAPIWKP